MPFGSITDEMARAYGEGERTVEWWRRVMGDFYRASAARHDAVLTEDTPHVWEVCEVVRRFGEDRLRELAKLHFKTTQEVLRG